MHLHELRREDSADGAGIDRSVGVAASLPVDRAGVHAGSATDAAEGLTLGFFGQHPGAAVVEQDDMKALGSVAGRDPGPDRGVGIHALAGGGAGQHLEHHFKVLEAGEHLLNAGDGDHGARRVRHMRPLPSDSTTTTEPVSATRKLAPLMAVGIERNFWRR